MQSLLPSMNKLGGIPWSEEEEIYTDPSYVNIARKRNEGKFARHFYSLLQIFDNGPLWKIFHVNGTEWLTEDRQIVEYNRAYLQWNETV